jgi:hypothetical protein
MKTYHAIKTLALGGIAMFSLASCSLDYEPLSEPSEITQGGQTETSTAVLKDKAAADAQLKSLYELFRNRQEHTHLDYLLIGDSHSDNAYAGTTGAEVVPYETNSIDASNSVLSRDWNRYLEDIAQANVLINGVEQLKENGQISEAEYHSYKAQGEIFRALMMFRMARLWGSFPVITTIAKTITSENINEVYPTYYPPRKTPKECYEQIIADLTDAEQYAPDNDNSDRTKMTKTVAQAMLAKVYAEKEVPDYNYTKVLNWKVLRNWIDTVSKKVEIHPEYLARLEEDVANWKAGKTMEKFAQGLASAQRKNFLLAQKVPLQKGLIKPYLVSHNHKVFLCLNDKVNMATFPRVKAATVSGVSWKKVTGEHWMFATSKQQAQTVVKELFAKFDIINRKELVKQFADVRVVKTNGK